MRARLGAGGMGVVWEAEQLSLRRRVALKVLSPNLSLSPENLHRFQREAEAGARLSHPGIVAVYFIGEEDGTQFIAQELVPGGYTLADRLEELRGEERVPRGHDRAMAEFFARVADALHAVHGAGIQHRDVKPSNVLIAPDGSPKVADFGLAHVEDALALSRTGDFAGTPFYMSPEQAASKRIGIDHRTDIFSLGATFYEALTLTRPFEGTTSLEVLEKILMLEPSDPRKLRAGIPRELAAVCARALEKRREKRYPDMAALAADLRRYLRGEPVHARPLTLARRARSLARVHRRPLLSLAAAAGIALSFLAGREFFASEVELEPEVREALERLLAEAPESESAATLRRWLVPPATSRSSPTLLEELRGGDPSDLGPEHKGALQAARSALDEGEPAESVRVLSALADLGSRSAAQVLWDASAALVDEAQEAQRSGPSSAASWRVAAEGWGRLAEALPGLGFPPDSLEVLRSLDNRAWALEQQGDLESALPALDELVAAYARKSPRFLPSRLPRLRLAAAQAGLGRYADALQTVEQLIAEWEQTYAAGAEPAELAQARGLRDGVLAALRAQGRELVQRARSALEEGERGRAAVLCGDVIDLWDGVLPDDDPGLRFVRELQRALAAGADGTG